MKVCLVLMLLVQVEACSSSRTSPGPATASSTQPDAAAAGACGTPNADSHCLSVAWPRLVVAFGDLAAAGLSYTFRADDGFVSSDRNSCPSGYGESSVLHCDLAFYASPLERLVTLEIADAAKGAALVSRQITLETFNRCGNGVAQVVVTTSDSSVPQVSEVQDVNVCGSL